MNEPDSKFKQHLLIATYIIVLSYILLNLKDVTHFMLKGLSIISPLTVGFAVAFILNIPMKLFENKVLSFLDQSKKAAIRNLKRPLAITLTFISVFGFLIGLILFIIPQLAQSVSTLVSVVPSYLTSLEVLVNKYISSSDLINKITSEIMVAWKDLAKIGSTVLGTSLSGLLTMTLGFTSGVVNFMLSLVLAIYMLSSKEKLLVQIKKFIFAFLKKETAQKIIHIGKISNMAFYNFIAGQFTEALILGVLCFVGMSVFSMPYALLISVIIAVSNIIPIFGPFIGMLLGAFIILIVNPITALWFIVFTLVLQQFESNIIYPRVVGNSIGLSGLWVMLAITIGGNTFGMLGMLVGIPLFSIIYQLLRTAVNNRLKAKAHVKNPVK